MPRTLTGKLSLATAVFLLLLALVGGNAVLAVRDTSAVGAYLTEKTIPFALASDRFNLHLSRAFAAVERFALQGQEEAAAEARAERLIAGEALARLARLAHDTESRIVDHADAQAALQQRRENLFASASRAIDSVILAVAMNDPVAMQEALAAIEAGEAAFAELERDSNALVAEDAAEASAALTIRNQLIQMLAPVGFFLLGLLGLLMLWFLRRNVVIPLLNLASITRRVAAGDLDHIAEVTSTDEIGDLQLSFNQMTGTLRAQRAAVKAREEELRKALEEVEQRAINQERLLAAIQQQQQVIRELTVPVLPVSQGTLVVPLVGAVDSARLAMLNDRALRQVERSKAQRLILDITGVPVVDKQVAQGLMQVLAALRLLGCEGVLVGVQPEVAQAMVGSGLDLDAVRTYSDLQAALAHAPGGAQPRGPASRPVAAEG